MELYTDEILQAINRWNGILSSPSQEALKSPKGLRVIKNAFIEKWIATAHPIVPGIWVLPLATFCLWKGLGFQNTKMLTGLVLAGVVSWTLLEYSLHMILFHKKITPGMNPSMKRFLFMLHGYHHEYPNDPGRLVMPIIIAWPLAAVVGLTLWLALGSSYFFGLFGGLLLGYLSYDWMHYYTHHVRPSTQLGKYLREFHAIHHYIDEKHNFGISSPLWDWVMGRAREPKTRLFKSGNSMGARV